MKKVNITFEDLNEVLSVFRVILRDTCFANDKETLDAYNNLYTAMTADATMIWVPASKKVGK